MVINAAPARSTGGRVRPALALTLALAAAGLPSAIGLAAADSPTSVVAGDAVVEPSGVGPSAPAVDDVATQAPAGAGVTSIEVSEAGRVRKELGEPAGLTEPGASSALFEITVSDVSVMTTCPGREVAPRPVRGYFVVIDLTARMADEGRSATAGDEGLFMPLVADAFGVVAADGSVVATPSEASWSCFEDVELAPPFVGAGESASGKVVLDSAVSAGTLVYTPGGNLGWEWAFGR
jgi:hypothetical protein